MTKERIYLAVPYEQHMAARRAGALWDQQRGAWYTHGFSDALARWTPRDEPIVPPLASDPRDDFAATLRDLGCLIRDPHPLMDGLAHRIATEGDKHGRKSGFYVLHGDGRPAGYVINHRTGESLTWKATGAVLAPEDRAQLRAQAANRARAAEQAREQRHRSAAHRAATRLAHARVLADGETTAYLTRKGVAARQGLCASDDGQRTWVPIHDTTGRIWTLQSIAANGDKRYLKGGRIQGCFHVLGGMGPLERAAQKGVVLLAEGYATAATALDIAGAGTAPVTAIAALHANNLPHVAEALRSAYPQAKLLIAADDDRTNGINAGRKYATEAAALVDAQVCFPPFTDKHPTELSDWNDLDQCRLPGYDAEKHRTQLRQAIAACHRQRTTTALATTNRQPFNHRAAEASGATKTDLRAPHAHALATSLQAPKAPDRTTQLISGNTLPGRNKNEQTSRVARPQQRAERCRKR